MRWAVCSGGFFLILTLAGIRQMIVAAIPAPVRGGGGGHRPVYRADRSEKRGLVVNSPATGLALGNLHERGRCWRWSALCWWWFCMWRVNAAILIAIAATTVLAWVVGAVHLT
jgi:AGZA family xanthine/uracil permease-like MFS transporter